MSPQEIADEVFSKLQCGDFGGDTEANQDRALVAGAISAAVLAERERCARIADGYADDPHGGNPSCATGEAIASEIREGTCG